MLKKYIKRLKNKFNCCNKPKPPTTYENQWGWDANGSPISKETRNKQKDEQL